MHEPPLRRYRIINVLGQGGFGKVYRARLEDHSGFSKEVAVKMLLGDDLPEPAVQRFRDEARILGLLRDRAIVGVDPPTRIGGQWAVVMELIDGASCSAILRHNGTFPVGVAVEIVGEVARALQRAWDQPGPDGRPVRLLHRDIKPGNLQLTPHGEVKILDFGIARADFQARESKTTTHIGGTPGYIAPERLCGDEGPKADVYSLGVVLHVLLAGGRPPTDFDSPGDHPIERDAKGLLAEAFALSRRMTLRDPRERLGAREVEQTCRELRRASGDLWLRDWIERALPPHTETHEDPMLGELVTETLLPYRAAVEAESDSASTRWRAALLALGGTGLVVAMATLALGAGIAGGFWLYFEKHAAPPSPTFAALAMASPQPAPDVAQPATAEAVLDEAPVDEAQVDEAPVDEAPVPEVALAEPPVPEAPPAPRHATSHSSKRAPALLRPAGPLVTAPVSITSTPLGATVVVDGRTLGPTPITNVILSAGAHRVELRTGERRSVHSFTLGDGAPRSFEWVKADDSWLDVGDAPSQ